MPGSKIQDAAHVCKRWAMHWPIVSEDGFQVLQVRDDGRCQPKSCCRTAITIGNRGVRYVARPAAPSSLRSVSRRPKTSSSSSLAQPERRMAMGVAWVAFPDAGKGRRQQAHRGEPRGTHPSLTISTIVLPS